jgi:hypothetical protein
MAESAKLRCNALAKHVDRRACQPLKIALGLQGGVGREGTGRRRGALRTDEPYIRRTLHEFQLSVKLFARNAFKQDGCRRVNQLDGNSQTFRPLNSDDAIAQSGFANAAWRAEDERRGLRSGVYLTRSRLERTTSGSSALPQNGEQQVNTRKCRRRKSARIRNHRSH